LVSQRLGENVKNNTKCNVTVYGGNVNGLISKSDQF